MTYEELLQRLVGLRRFGMRPGLDGIRELLDALGRPFAGGTIVHVGGTNGKGSTAAMIEAGLRADGRRTGLYTSPHLLRFTERIRVNGDEIAPELAARLGEEILAASKRGGPHTFFEIATAMALVAFERAAVDVAVLEVGLGGRLDATNVVERPAVAVVTSVGLDHVDVLGGTRAEIAREKAGIWKRGCPALFACEDEEAATVLAAEAARVGAAPIERFGRELDDRGLPRLALAGAHQRRNAALARRALERMGVTARAIAEGLGTVRWPGRMERLSPTVMVDAAHNEEGARALAAAWPAGDGDRGGHGGDTGWTLVVGVVADKDARAIIEPLVAKARRVIVTAPPSARALPAEELARWVPGAVVTKDLAEALAVAAAAGEKVVVAGSIFLVGEARRIVLGEAADGVAAQDPPARQKL